MNENQNPMMEKTKFILILLSEFINKNKTHDRGVIYYNITCRRMHYIKNNVVCDVQRYNKQNIQ